MGSRKTSKLRKRIAVLERKVQSQQFYMEILMEFSRSVANKENMGLISYQQLNSPSTDGNQKVRMLLQRIGELG